MGTASGDREEQGEPRNAPLARAERPSVLAGLFALALAVRGLHLLAHWNSPFSPSFYLPIDARLDLHGHYQDAAHAELNTFIAGCAASGCRLVLVITGKGDPASAEGRGVLRRMVPTWLNAVEFRPFVVGYGEARRRHGGRDHCKRPP